MFVKYINKLGETITVDNTGKSIGEVVIQGDNPNDVEALNLIINSKTKVLKGVNRDTVKSNPNRFKIINNVVHRNTANDYYIKNELPVLMERRGYSITSK